MSISKRHLTMGPAYSPYTIWKYTAGMPLALDRNIMKHGRVCHSEVSILILLNRSNPRSTVGTGGIRAEFLIRSAEAIELRDILTPRADSFPPPYDEVAETSGGTHQTSDPFKQFQKKEVLKCDFSFLADSLMFTMFLLSLSLVAYAGNANGLYETHRHLNTMKGGEIAWPEKMIKDDHIVVLVVETVHDVLTRDALSPSQAGILVRN
ncbi:hypothetical protein VTO42DRAFT_2381 [Malbranchea cinnamomea]